MDPVDVVRPGDIVVDCGANIGEYTARFAQAVGPTGYVLAIEPGSDAAQQARVRLATIPHAQVLQVALGATPGTTVLTLGGNHGDQSTLTPANTTPAGQEVVAVARLDDLVARLPGAPRLIKVDVQGSEGILLAGAAQTLTVVRPIWYIELWPLGLTQAGSSVEAVCRAFQEAGYMPTLDPTHDPLTWDACVASANANQGHSSSDVFMVPR